MQPLTEKNIIIDTANLYNNFCQERNDNNGICFGASLHLVTDLLKDAGSNKKDVCMMEKHINKMHNILIRNASKFNDYARYMQQVFQASKSYTPLLIDRVKVMVDLLNSHETLLGLNRQSEAMRHENKLIYSFISGLEAYNEINGMLQFPKDYENTALLITTKLKRESPEKAIYAHQSVLINQEKSLYFYDPNRGVYALKEMAKESLHCKTLLVTLAKTFGLDSGYRLSHGLHHIRIQTDIPPATESDTSGINK